MKKIAVVFVFGILCFVAIVALLQTPFGEIVFWTWDDISGYDFEFPAERCGDYIVALRQEAGSDFYDSYFQIIAADGRSTRLIVDADDARWWKPRRVERAGRIYYLTGSDQIEGSTSYIDVTNGVLYAGYYKRSLNIDDIDPDLPYQ